MKSRINEQIDEANKALRMLDECLGFATNIEIDFIIEEIFMSLKNSVEFLIFTYFGIDFNDDFDTILKSAIKVAYNDATMQGAYNALEKENAEEIDYDEVAQELEKAIKKLLNDNSNSYEQWHKDICEELVKCYEKVTSNNKNPAFSYGNAQKWVNMTMKYLYILSEIFHDFNKNLNFEKYYDIIQKLYKEFQVPVDSFIIESVWDEKKQIEGIPYNIDKLNKATDSNGNRIPGKYNSEKVVPWSKWADKEYFKFQKTLSRNQPPLDWEHKAWIEIAKKRREK